MFRHQRRNSHQSFRAFNLPRLSVDIDLTFTRITDRPTAIREIKSGFLALALSHNRPLHELLNPTLQDHEDIFNQQFAGMSDTPFSYQEHKDTFNRLRKELLGSLTAYDKQHLLDFVSLQGRPEDFDIPHLTELPAIIWKRKNLAALKISNPLKFAEQRKLLEKLLAQS